MTEKPMPRVVKLAGERALALLKESEAMDAPDAMLFLTSAATPLFVTGFKLASSKGRRDLGRM